MLCCSQQRDGVFVIPDAYEPHRRDAFHDCIAIQELILEVFLPNDNGYHALFPPNDPHEQLYEGARLPVLTPSGSEAASVNCGHAKEGAEKFGAEMRQTILRLHRLASSLQGSNLRGVAVHMASAVAHVLQLVEGETAEAEEQAVSALWRAVHWARQRPARAPTGASASATGTAASPSMADSVEEKQTGDGQSEPCVSPEHSPAVAGTTQGVGASVHLGKEGVEEGEKARGGENLAIPSWCSLCASQSDSPGSYFCL